MKTKTLNKEHQEQARQWIISQNRNGLGCRDCGGSLMAPMILISDDEGSLSIIPFSCGSVGVLLSMMLKL